MYERMLKIRHFENRVKDLFAAGEMPGFVHLYLGEEAVAVGACAALNDDDYITSTHRGHGHIIAKGGDVKRMMAELYGKATGYNKGKGGSMHIADPSLGILGANGIVGAGLPIADKNRERWNLMRPLLADESCHLTAVVTDIDEETGIVELDLSAKNSADETRVFGTARVQLPPG